VGEIEVRILATLRKYHFVGVDTMGFIYHFEGSSRDFRARFILWHKFTTNLTFTFENPSQFDERPAAADKVGDN